jgi:hypothetical protein
VCHRSPSLLLRLADAGSADALRTLRLSESLRGRRLTVAAALREQAFVVAGDAPELRGSVGPDGQRVATSTPPRRPALVGCLMCS